MQLVLEGRRKNFQFTMIIELNTIQFIKRVDKYLIYDI